MGLFAHADTLYMMPSKIASIIFTFSKENVKNFTMEYCGKLSFRLRWLLWCGSTSKASPWGEAVKNLRFLTDEGCSKMTITDTFRRIRTAATPHPSAFGCHLPLKGKACRLRRLVHETITYLTKRSRISAWRRWPPFPAWTPGPGRSPENLPPPSGSSHRKTAETGSAFPGGTGFGRHFAE